MENNNPFDPIFVLDKYILNDKIDQSLLYHYTNSGAATSIKNNNTGHLVLWHMKHCNDPHEHTKDEIYYFYIEAIEEIANLFPSSIIQRLKKITITENYYFFSYHTTNEKGVAYICSFSKLKNSEYLWDKFNKDGKSMEMLAFYKANLVEQTNKSFDGGYIHSIKNVIYDDEEKIEYIKSFLIKLLKTKKYNTLKYCVESFLNICRFFLKPNLNEYSSEQEVRSVIILKKKDSDLADNYSKQNNQPSHYSMLLPFNCFCESQSLKK